MPSTLPIALSDTAMSQLISICKPLSPIDRDRLLQLLAERLNGRREVGDGEFHRLCVALQREVFVHPVKTSPAPQHFNGRRMRTR
jgi:hypothetical protein